MKPTSYDLLFVQAGDIGWSTGFQNKMKVWFDIRIHFKLQRLCPEYVHEDSISLACSIIDSVWLIPTLTSLRSDCLDKLKSGMKS